MKNIEVLILARSVKKGNHCIAGKCIKTRQWVRPVSDTNGGELNDEQIKYENPHGKYPVKPLQRMVMSFASHVPLLNQPENYLIDGKIWKQNYNISLDELEQFLDEPDDLWGMDDKVSYKSIGSKEIVIEQSLYLIQVEKLKLYRNKYNKKRALFLYNGQQYDFAVTVTDSEFDKICSEKKEIKGILCISLGEEYNGDCYKLVAAIF